MTEPMNHRLIIVIGLLLCVLSFCWIGRLALAQEVRELPPPMEQGTGSVEEALASRRSVRQYADRALTLEEAGQLLWAAQGISDPGRGFRTAPSAGALYPLQTYLAAGAVEDLPAGLYRYHPSSHSLEQVMAGDVRDGLFQAALRQTAVRSAPAVILLTGNFAVTEARYGDRAVRYVWIEVGHAAQNIALQSESLGLASVPIGAFADDQVSALLDLPSEEAPLYLIPVGAHPKGAGR